MKIVDIVVMYMMCECYYVLFISFPSRLYWHAMFRLWLGGMLLSFLPQSTFYDTILTILVARIDIMHEIDSDRLR